MPPTATQLDLYRTAIPMRPFEHAAARRSVAEAVVVRLHLADGRCGWGECLPRPYVTGETIQSVLDAIQNQLWPAMAGRELTEDTVAAATACRASAALDRSEATPGGAAGDTCINSSACAMELALFDAGAVDLAGPDAGAQGKGTGRLAIASRVSGVLGSADPAKMAKRLRLMRWFGLRDFKLKLGFEPAVDQENLRIIRRKLAKALAAGKCTLRVDVNGGWTRDDTTARVAEMKSFGVCVVEQPVYCEAVELAELARRCELPLMADESLLSESDADALSGPNVWWNIRISKNGGLRRAARLAELAQRRGVPYVVGAMVGESSILSAAQRRLLQVCRPGFVEGNYGKFLLSDDLTRKGLRFGYGGRLSALSGPGLGVRVDERKLGQYAQHVATLR